MTNQSLNEALQLAQELLSQGELEQSLTVCEKILTVAADNWQSHLLIGQIRQAQEQWELAKAHLEKVQTLQPSHPLAHLLMGQILSAQGQSQLAKAHFKQGVELSDYDPMAVEAFAGQLESWGEVNEAIGCLETALKIHSGQAQLWFSWANLHNKQNQRQQAVHGYEKAVELDPGLENGWFLLGVTELETENFAQAKQALDRVIALNPNHAPAYHHRGHANNKLGNQRQALSDYEHSLSLDPNNAVCHTNLASFLMDESHPTLALLHLLQAQTIQPTLTEGHLNSSFIWLMGGALKPGWEAYEWGLKTPQRRDLALSPPHWQGEDLTHKRILVTVELGVGDQVCYASCIPDLLDRGGEVILECDKRLQPLFARSFPTVAVQGVEREALATLAERDYHWLAEFEPVDYRLPVGSLPLHFRENQGDFPNHQGYLVVDPERKSYWKDRLDELGEGLKVGICWRSGVQGMRRHSHSQLEGWKPLFNTPGCEFISLQYGVEGEELEQISRRSNFHIMEGLDLFNQLDDQTALMASLDLVISVHTVVANLAGAVGRPVWLTTHNPTIANLGTERVPWYPSMRPLTPRGLWDDWTMMMGVLSQELYYLVKGAAPHR